MHFGDFDSTRPVSLDFGFDRGLPVDRYYVENFLAKHARDIRGHVLEIGDDTYTKRFGSNLDKVDILHVRDGNAKATIIGDLAMPGLLPCDRFDCIVLTQTLHLIYDMTSAVSTFTSLSSRRCPIGYCARHQSDRSRRMARHLVLGLDPRSGPPPLCEPSETKMSKSWERVMYSRHAPFCMVSLSKS